MNIILFGITSLVFLMGWIGHSVYCDYTPTEPTKQPTVKCTYGKLYDVSYEGNITIIKERPFTTCEER